MGRPKLEDRPNTAITRADRPRRVPINGHKDILNVSGKEPGFHYCWVGDSSQAGGVDNVPRFLAAGYEFVTHDVMVGDAAIDVASQKEPKVTVKLGNLVTGYLMRLPQEYYDEDQKDFNKSIDLSEQDMRQNLNSGSDGRYGEVKISRGRP